MASAPHTTANPTVENPSNSETREPVAGSVATNQYPKDSVPAAEVSNQQSKVGTTEKPGTSAEEAAEKLYEERIEDEYAKREGGA
ncbi:hypothetical protein MBLNU230_g1089t1 [Neophaeotheca triangularis]